MRAKLKDQLQCRDCKMPYCDALCTDLSNEQIDWIMGLVNKRVIEELESILDKTQLATKVDSIRSHIAYRNTEYKPK